MTKQTKSERLFNNAFFEAKRVVKDEAWTGVKVDALGSLHDGTNECICQRTVNDIRRHAERKQREIDFRERHGEDMSEQREALAIVLKTCDNWERDEAEFKAHLAAL